MNIEKSRRCGTVRSESENCGIPLICWKIEYPIGITKAADDCYVAAAEAFEKCCTGKLRELVQRDYDNDTDPRKRYRRRAWNANFIADVDEITETSAKVTLTISICANKRTLLFKQLTDTWAAAEYLTAEYLRM